MKRTVTFSVLAILLSLGNHGHALADQDLKQIVTAKPPVYGDNRFQYAELLLEKALKKSEFSGGATSVTHAKVAFSHKRMLQELITGKNIQVTAAISNGKWDQSLVPIRIPILNGLNGFRLFLINEQDQRLFNNVKSIDDLKKLTTGVNSQWATRDAMENANFSVVTADNYASLFDMLKFRRFNSISRGIDEVFLEQARFSKENSDLVVERNFGIYLPMPTYFYVSPKYPQLAEHIQQGLERMISDGSFDEHFIDFYQEHIKQARLDERKFFRISNSFHATDDKFEKISMSKSDLLRNFE